jgi:hypothetical protein
MSAVLGPFSFCHWARYCSCVICTYWHVTICVGMLNFLVLIEIWFIWIISCVSYCSSNWQLCTWICAQVGVDTVFTQYSETLHKLEMEVKIGSTLWKVGWSELAATNAPVADEPVEAVLRMNILPAWCVFFFTRCVFFFHLFSAPPSSPLLP